MRIVAMVIVVVALGTVSPATAQVSPIEISIDGGLTFSMINEQENVTELSLPFNWFRIGVGVSEQLHLEGAVQFQHMSQGNNSITTVRLHPGLAYHFQPFNRQAPRPYVGAFGSLAHAGFSIGGGSDGDTQLGFGTALGIKMPVWDVAFLRFEGMFAHNRESDRFVSSNALTLSVGLGAVLN